MGSSHNCIGNEWLRNDELSPVETMNACLALLCRGSPVGQSAKSTVETNCGMFANMSHWQVAQCVIFITAAKIESDVLFSLQVYWST